MEQDTIRNFQVLLKKWWAESDLLVYNYFPDQKRLLLVLIDMEDTVRASIGTIPFSSIPYTFLFRVIQFREVRDYQRTNWDAKLFSHDRDSCHLEKHKVNVLIEGMNFEQKKDRFEGVIDFERGFGTVSFSCREIDQWPIPVFSKSDTPSLFLDQELSTPFDWDQFTAGIYQHPNEVSIFLNPFLNVHHQE